MDRHLTCEINASSQAMVVYNIHLIYEYIFEAIIFSWFHCDCMFWHNNENQLAFSQMTHNSTKPVLFEDLVLFQELKML